MFEINSSFSDGATSMTLVDKNLSISASMRVFSSSSNLKGVGVVLCIGFQPDNLILYLESICQ